MNSLSKRLKKLEATAPPAVDEREAEFSAWLKTLSVPELHSLRDYVEANPNGSYEEWERDYRPLVKPAAVRGSLKLQFTPQFSGIVTVDNGTKQRAGYSTKPGASVQNKALTPELNK